MDYGRIAFQNLMEKIEKEGLTLDIRKFLEVILPKQLIDRTMRLIYQEAKIKYHIAIFAERSFWTFDTHNTIYYVFCDQDSCFCSCPSYEKDVIRDGRYPFCKHILAALLCDSLRKKGETSQFTIDEMEDNEFAAFMANTIISATFGKKSKK